MSSHVTDYNHFHNISPSFSFTTSETMRDYYLETQYIRVVERLWKLKNIRKVPELCRMIAQSQPPSKNEKTCEKQQLNPSRSAPPHTKTRDPTRKPETAPNTPRPNARRNPPPPDPNTPQTPPNPPHLTNLINLKPFTLL